MNTRQLLTVAASLCLIACSEFYSLDVSVKNSQLAFSTEDGKGVEFAADSLAVIRQDCQQDCTYWAIRRDPKSYDDETLFVTTGSIEYGSLPAQMITETDAQELVSGRYRVSAGIYYPIDGEKIGGGTYDQLFTLKVENGQLALVKD